MTPTTMTADRPIQGVPDGASSPDPTIRQRWLEQRRGGITATEVRDWGSASKRREIIASKITGVENEREILVKSTGFTLNDYARHGRAREPQIADWVRRKFGIAPCEHVYTHGANPRHLASPDGVTLDPLTGELVIGRDADLAEIKTATKDLTPGKLDANRVLIEVDESSAFASKNYYTQMQWQMYVMNANRTLFVWEQHDGKVDPETGTFSPVGPPLHAWIPRNDKLIAVLIDVAERALAEIDAARLSMTSDQVPVAAPGLDAERAQLVSDYLASLDAESTANKAKAHAWAALQAHYLGEGKPDATIKVPGFANVTVSTSSGVKKVVDEEGMRKKAPSLVQKYEALRERYTSQKPTSTQKLTITRAKG